MKKSALSIALLFLAACSQNPQFKINTANQVYSALNNLQVLLAQSELGLFAKPASFPDQADSYASVMGGFSAGRFVAIATPPLGVLLGEGAPAAGDGVVEQCVDQIRQMALQHKASGIAPTSGIIRTVRSSCDAAARAVAANESSALLLTTAAGDL